jgi:hypothetical protein
MEHMQTARISQSHDVGWQSSLVQLGIAELAGQEQPLEGQGPQSVAHQRDQQ